MCVNICLFKDYESQVLNLNDSSSYRRLDRPIAVQNEDRSIAVAARFREAQSMIDNLELDTGRSKFNSVYHYPSHCSNEAIVLHFLVRMPPYTFRHLRFQGKSGFILQSKIFIYLLI